MSWLWLGLLAVAGAGLWLRHRQKLQADAMLQESIDRSSPQDEPKRPPAKQPWQRPGFGPAPRMDALEFGTGPVPPAAGGGEDPTVAGPMPDDEDIPALIPIEALEEEEPTSAKLPPPPPPPPPPPGASFEPGDHTEEGPSEPPVEAAMASTLPVGPIEDASNDVLGDEGEAEFAPIRDPQVLDLPADLEAEARSLMERKQEVAAVRLVCDSMGVGILDAQRTVRSLVDR